MVNVISFQEAITMSSTGKRHLLLGNGFSIDWKDIFKYEALVEQADFSTLNVDGDQLFELLKTRDFESVIEALRKAKMLSEYYSTTDQTLSDKFQGDAEAIKRILTTTIASNHPDFPNEISPSEYVYCRQFLTNFSNIYTLNYDLLLYWVLMHTEGGEDIECDDGFRDSDDESADYVVWDNGDSHHQNIHYLHGALHLFDAGVELKKFTWIKTGIKLIDQIRDALDHDLFPLIVTEGESDEKLTKINHSGYLHKAKRSFSGISGSLFIHGHSLSDNDDHILSLIPETKVNKLFISTMSDPNAPENIHKISKIDRYVRERSKMLEHTKSKSRTVRQELEVYFYQANTAHIWRK